MKDAYYFSHDGNARNDEKLLAVRMKYKWEGYGLFWAIVEKLRESTDYILSKDYNLIAFDLRTDASIIKSLIEDFGLFVFTEDGKYFYSERLSNSMDLKESKSKQASENAFKRWNKSESNTIAMQTHSERNAIKVKEKKKSKENESKKENENEKKEETAVEILTESQEVILFLNKIANRFFDHKSKHTLKHVNCRLANGFTKDELMEIAQLKTFEWLNNDKMQKYLTPDTLFNSENCEKYREQLKRAKSNPEQFKKSINGNSNNQTGKSNSAMEAYKEQLRRDLQTTG